MKIHHSFVFILISVLIFGPSAFVQAQRNCATMDNLERLIQLDSRAVETMERVEAHIQQYEESQDGFTQVRVNQVYTIPVVVHVVYRTSSENIGDAQIQSQLAIMNQDFRKTNSDRVNTPSVFSGLAADAEVEFCLAQFDPQGNPTSGVTRTFTNSTSFGANDGVKYSSSGGKDGWPASNYLNLWVCNLSGGLLGYAQFPGSGSSATDGVVIGYTYFGNTGAAQYPFNKGRTTTHEVGHWLNLRHIWGDSFCGNDLVSDTPTQQKDNSGCPSHPHATCSNSGDMFMNYMDYVDDRCMNMFSNGQKTRMRAVLSPGGFRNSLLSSTACGGAGGGSTGYCTSNGQNSTYEWVASVKISDLNNGSGDDGGYADYTNKSASLGQGQTYNFSLQPGFSGQAYNEYWKIWIDYNQDEDFDDAGELAYDQGGMSSSTVTGSLTVPAGAAGGETRMRVQMKYNAAGTQCESFTYGEVEDYAVSIRAACNVPSGLSASSITGTSATLSWSNSGAVSYKVRWRATGTSTWSSGSTSGTSGSISSLSPGTTYEFQVQSVCNSNSSAYSASSTFTTTAPPSATYCTSTGQNTQYEWISQVVVGTINNTSGSNGGYQDFTNLSTNLQQGTQYTATLVPGFASSSYNEYWRIWVDLNQDGDFDDSGEMVYDQGRMSTSTVAANFLIPGSSSLGNTTMRVQMKYNAAGTPCETFTYGEVEDYGITVTQSTTQTCVDSYEPNNSSGAAPVISSNTDVSAFICPAGDNDWYKFSNTASKRNIRVTMSNLAADYDLYLYDSGMNYINKSENYGTNSEEIIYNSAPVGTYYIWAYGYNGAYSSTVKYKLRASTSAASFNKLIADTGGPEKSSPLTASLDRVEIYPNPANAGLTLNYYTETEADLQIQVIDLQGRVLSFQSGLTRSGNNRYEMNVSELANGLYLVRMILMGQTITRKLEVRH